MLMLQGRFLEFSKHASLSQTYPWCPCRTSAPFPLFLELHLRNSGAAAGYA